jgi:type IV pilus assembly protein PilB
MRRLFWARLEVVVACRTEILIGIEKHYASAVTLDLEPPVAPSETFDICGRDELDVDQVYPRLSDFTPAVQLCSLILRDAITLRASDIHIEPGLHELRVRLRVDGVLRELLQMPRWMHTALVSRIKILATLDIAKQRIPQDGRIKIRSHDEAMDVRVSTLPIHFGEKVVMRLLRSANIPTPAELGLSADEMSLIEDALGQPQAFILVTGPTGAGKSTTLYSCSRAGSPRRSTSSRSRTRSSITCRTPPRCRWTSRRASPSPAVSARS